MNYLQYVAQLSDAVGILKGDVNFPLLVPSAIEYAEQRIYRELDLLNTVTRQTVTILGSGRQFSLPTTNGRFVVTNGINVITPSGTTDPDLGTRNPLTPCSYDVLNMLWPSSDGAATPTMFAMLTDQSIILGPWPDTTYTLEVVGTIRPNQLSADNPETYLTLYLPDLFLAASQLFLSTKDYGSKASDPNKTVIEEQKYQMLLGSANAEEQRKRYASGGWGSLSRNPIATPNR